MIMFKIQIGSMKVFNYAKGRLKINLNLLFYLIYAVYKNIDLLMRYL